MKPEKLRMVVCDIDNTLVVKHHALTKKQKKLSENYVNDTSYLVWHPDALLQKCEDCCTAGDWKMLIC